MSRILLALACLLSCLPAARADDASRQVIDDFNPYIWSQVQSAIINGQTATTFQEALWVGRSRARQYIGNYCTAHVLTDDGPYSSISFECLDADDELASLTRVQVSQGSTLPKAIPASTGQSVLSEGECAADTPVHLPGNMLGIKLHCVNGSGPVDVNIAINRPTLLNTNQ